MIRIKVLLASCALVGLTLTTSCTAAPNQSAQKQPTKDIRTQQVLGNQFRSGFYYYDAKIDGQTPSQKIADDLNRMADLGFNYVHANVAIYEGRIDYPQIDRLLEICAKRGMAVRLQCTGAAYLSNALAGRHTDQWKAGWNVERLVKAVAPFIKKYQKNPNVIGFSIQEEPDVEVLPLLSEYYEALLEEVPDAPLILLYNNLDVAVKDKENHYPQHSSHDNYPFKRSSMNGTYNFRTPSFALNFYASQMDAFQQLAQNKGQAFESAFSGFAEQAELGSPSARDKNMAAIGNQGYSLGKDGNVLRWNRYRPPVNYVSAMCWTAVSKGADSLADYAWMGTSKSEKRKSRTALVLGWDNKGSRVLDEYAAFAKEIRPFGKLMRSVSRDITSFTLPPTSADIVPIGPPSNPVLQVADKDIVWDSFTVPNYKGKMIVIVNTKIGSWSNAKSPMFLKDTDAFHIDANGEMTDFTSFTEKRNVATKVLLPQSQAIDLMTGEKIKITADGKMNLNIAPGGGRILFLSPAGNGELQKVMKEYQLPATKGQNE